MSAGAGSETEGLYVTLGAWLTYHDKLRYREICAELGVDDFWVDYSTSHLHQMRLAVRRDDLYAQTFISDWHRSDPVAIMRSLRELVRTAQSSATLGACQDYSPQSSLASWAAS